MANKRTFKRALDLMGGELCENMMIAYVNAEKADKKLISDAIGKVLSATEAARMKSNIFFDRGVKAFASRKEYEAEKKKFFKALYSKILAEYNETIGEALKLYNTALPESLKAQQKESVAK